MTFAEIESLLERGFTPQQITELQSAPAPAQDQTQTTAQGSAQDQTQTQTTAQATAQTQTTVPDWASALTDTIKGLQRTIQAQALAGAEQQAPKSVDALADDALASILTPTFANTKGGK